MLSHQYFCLYRINILVFEFIDELILVQPINSIMDAGGGMENRRLSYDYLNRVLY